MLHSMLLHGMHLSYHKSLSIKSFRLIIRSLNVIIILDTNVDLMRNYLETSAFLLLVIDSLDGKWGYKYPLVFNHQEYIPHVF